MPGKLSRTKIARYAAQQLQAGNTEVIREVAALIVDERRLREVDLITRSILEQLEQDGIVLVDTTATESLSDAIQQQIKELTGAQTLAIREHVDPTVLGGIRIETATRQLDATFARRLTQLRERKI